MSSSVIKIKIDYREREFYEKIKTAGLPEGCVLEEPVNLEIGDIIISVCNDTQIQQQSIIIERKRFDDLSASIKDGRYDEQKMRCMAYISNERNIGNDSILIYLLEGDLTYCRNNSDVNIVLGAWISMEMRDNIPVIRVINIDEGIKWIYRLCERIKKKPTDIFKENNVITKQITPVDSGEIKTIFLGGDNISKSDVINNETNIKQVIQTDYLGTIKTKKKDNITPETCAQVMLAVIPGISAETAKVVLDIHGNGSLVGLINTLMVNDNLLSPEERLNAIKDKKKALADVQLKPGRKLGPVMAEKIWDYIFMKKN